MITEEQVAAFNEAQSTLSDDTMTLLKEYFYELFLAKLDVNVSTPDLGKTFNFNITCSDYDVYPYAQMIKLQDDKIFVYTGDSWVYYSNYTTVDDLSTVKNTGIIYSKADDAFLTYVDGQYLRLHESRYDVTTSVEV